MARRLAVLLVTSVVCAAPAPAAIIDLLSLSEGRDDTNTLVSPVLDGASVPPVRIVPVQSSYDRAAKIIRRGTTGMFTKGPQYELAREVDMAALLTEALRSEAAGMGIRVVTDEAGAWQVGGSLNEIYMESKQIPYGATLFYGFMDTTFDVTAPDGRKETRRMRFHHYYGAYNAGLGRKDEARSGLAHLLLEGAQEAIARMNRDFFKAPAHPRFADVIRRLRESPDDVNRSELFAIGLSGSADAAAALIARLPGEKNENVRSATIDALAKIGSNDAVEPLARRYPSEDEDCRWYTLKAMDYIGGDAALGLVRNQGVNDKDGGPQRLARRILAGT